MGVVWDNGKENGNYYSGFRVYSPLKYMKYGFGYRVHYNTIPIYPMFYLLNGDHRSFGFKVYGLGFRRCGVRGLVLLGSLWVVICRARSVP